MLGVVRRVKKPMDKKLYIELQGDLLECLRKVILFKTEKTIDSTLKEFEKYKANGDTKESIRILENELKRLHRYMGLLSKVSLP